MVSPYGSREHCYGLDVDGRILTLRDLRALIPRYGFEVASIEEDHAARMVRVKVWDRGTFRDQIEQRLSQLRSTIDEAKPFAVWIEVTLTTRPEGPYR